MATFDPKKLGCGDESYRFGLLEILEKELKRPSIEFQQELKKIGDDSDIQKYLGTIFGADKFRGLTPQVIEADRKRPRKDKKEEFEGNSSGKLEVTEITELMVQTA